MSARKRARGVLTAVLVGGALLVPVLLGVDRRSVARGNRLYRGGDVAGAAGVYGHALGSSDAEATAYNLGTALLTLDGDSAELLLSRTTRSGDRATAQRGFYNLGYGQMRTAEMASAPDSVIPVLRAAVSSYRAALRLDPSDQDARWNLALAIRRLQSMLPPGEDTGQESGSESDDEVPMNDPQMARSETAPAESGPEPEDPRPPSDSGERTGPREGAREAWALQDPGPLTTARALELLARVEDDPEDLLKGILWSHRPDIAWWSGQPYPGGPW